jgi:hypothetical protein
MTSTDTQDTIHGEQKANSSLDVEQQQNTGTLLVETPKSLGAGVSLAMHPEDRMILTYQSPP